MLLLLQPKSVLKSRKTAFEGCLDDEDWMSSGLAEDSHHVSNQSEVVDHTNVSISIYGTHDHYIKYYNVMIQISLNSS